MRLLFWILIALIGVALILIIVLALSGSNNTNNPKIANPAAKFCVKDNYGYKIITAKDGSQQGICEFPDGSWCEEWSYYNGKCNIGDNPLA